MVDVAIPSTDTEPTTEESSVVDLTPLHQTLGLLCDQVDKLCHEERGTLIPYLSDIGRMLKKYDEDIYREERYIRFWNEEE